MNITIKNVVYRDYNNQDNLYFEIEEDLKELFRSTPIFYKSKIIEKGTRNEGTLWVRIWKCGIANFGYTVNSDPLHGYTKYTWSSNATCINDEFNLNGTPYELARYGAGINGWAGELTKDLALKIAISNKDSLHYGIDKYLKTISTHEY